MWGYGRSVWVEWVGSGCGFDVGDGVFFEGGDGIGVYEGVCRVGRIVDYWIVLVGDFDYVVVKRKVSVVWIFIGEVEKK